MIVHGVGFFITLQRKTSGQRLTNKVLAAAFVAYH